MLSSGNSNSICPVCLLGGGLDDPDEELAVIAPMLATTKVGATVGRYKLLEEIGEGGFGIVFRAAQTEPVKRQVALKVIKPGMDSKQVIARFEAERQALALMDHPNIAHVHDAGATENGRPYFVMELVKGIPITTYCDDRNLDTKARLRLFIDVCSAVQHAHQKGIIHRDLKPSNILVSAQHEQPVVKVIDFGIAKAISMELTEKTVFTELGQMIGTPQYMSPEQAHLNAVDVDTRSDIHSLGVILYELLTGKTPLDLEKLRSADYAEMQSMIRHEQPVKPSASLTSLGDTLPLIAQKRGTEQGRLQKVLRGDLDWIVMKALEKDRSRRYQTTNGLAVDIRRYLNSEPVSASPPSATYRLVQFTKKHRTGVTWSAVTGLVVMIAMIVSGILGLRAIKNGKIAQNNLRSSLVSDADNVRRNKDESERRWKSHEKLIEARDIPPGFDALPDGSDAKRNLRDTMICILAIADMRKPKDTDPDPKWMWKITPADGDGEMVAANRSLTKYAHNFRDGGIAIHNLPKGNAPPVILGTKGAELSGMLKFSPDGEILAAEYDQGDGNGSMVRLWRFDGKDWSEFGPGIHTDGGFAFFPDSRRCAIGRKKSGAYGIDIVSCETGRTDEPSAPLNGAPHSISVSRDGNLLAVSVPEVGEVAIVHVGGDEATQTLSCDSPGALAWGPVDDSLAVCTSDVLEVWGSQNWTLKPTQPALELRRLDRGVEDDVAWSPDGRLLASQCRIDGSSRLWDPFQGEELCSHGGAGSSIEFSNDGSVLGIFREGDTLSMYEVDAGNVCLRGRGHPRETDIGVGGIYDGVWNGEGSLLATSGSDGVRFWNREGWHLGYINIEEARGIAFSKNAFFIASEEGLFEWTMQSNRKEAEVIISLQPNGKIGNFRHCEQASIAGDWLAVAAQSAEGNGRRALWLVDLEDGGGEPHLLPESEGATSCAISANGLWLAAGLTDPSRVSVWEMPVGNPLVMPASPLEPFPSLVQGTARVAFSAPPIDSSGKPIYPLAVKWLITGDEEQYQFWNTDTWELGENQSSILSKMGRRSGRMAFSSRGTALALAVERDKLKVFALPDLEQSLGPHEFSSPDFDKEIPVCFSPYGRILVTTKPKGQIFFWKLDRVRSQLKDLGLDWGFSEFPENQPFDQVNQIIILPAADE